MPYDDDDEDLEAPTGPIVSSSPIHVTYDPVVGTCFQCSRQFVSSTRHEAVVVGGCYYCLTCRPNWRQIPKKNPKPRPHRIVLCTACKKPLAYGDASPCRNCKRAEFIRKRAEARKKYDKRTREQQRLGGISDYVREVVLPRALLLELDDAPEVRDYLGPDKPWSQLEAAEQQGGACATCGTVTIVERFTQLCELCYAAEYVAQPGAGELVVTQYGTCMSCALHRALNTDGWCAECVALDG